MKIGKKLKKLIGAVAPVLGGALGGPLGGVAGKFVADALGVDSEDAALALIDQNPESLLKIKEAEIAFETRMRELDIDLVEIHAKDRASARDLAKSTSLMPQIILGGLYTAAYLSTLFMFITGNVEVQEQHSTMVFSLMGSLGAVQIQILNFFFGSSSGSKEKTVALANGHSDD